MSLRRRNQSVVPARLDQQKYEGEVRSDPPEYITCRVEHPVKSFTITFDPKLLQKKIEKYGDALRVPETRKKP